MKVVLAEKPSVAREIAQHLRAGTRCEGYFQGDGYQVTWAYGHLAALKDPDEYDPAWKRWSLETLPIVPERFELKLVEQGLARKQFAVVKRLFRDAQEIVAATDAGREGELIFRYILQLAGCERKPFRRLWLSSLTPQAIREAFARLRPGHELDGLYAAARCRSEADWIVGMNGTRFYTVRFGSRGLLWSVGRVQTPVLAMIVRRDDEIRTFRPQPFWELLTVYRQCRFKFAGDRFSKEAEAHAMLARVQGQPFTIVKVDRRRERIPPPQLYDLTELQRDLNRRFGLFAAATLQAAQSQYEDKLITYPRTDSRYLTKDIQREVPHILESLRPERPEEIGRLNLDSLAWSARIVNDSKVSDHHAILPTGKRPGSLEGAKQKVFEAILTRLIAALYPFCEKEVTTAEGQSNGVPFRAKGYRVIEPGWTSLYPRKKDSEDQQDESQELPEFRPGERGPHEPSVKRGETTPPKPHTENTLLGAMETAGRLVDDDELREALKEKGLGTPATRAAIIETLLKRNYIQRQKKTLTATDLGRYLIAVVQVQDLKSPELTGQWEAKLRQIEAGRLDPQRFMAEITQYTQQIVAGQPGTAVDENAWGPCPRCGRPVIQGKRAFGCSAWRDGCTFVLEPVYGDRQLAPSEIRQLLQRRALLEPFPSTAGEPTILALTDTGQLTEIAVPASGQQTGRPARGRKIPGRTRKPPTKKRSRAAEGAGAEPGKAEKTDAASESLGACPLCGQPVIEQKKSFSCSGWRDGCPLVIWKTMAGKRITAKTAKELIRSSQTAMLKGFKSKAGKPFSARLRLVEGQVKFEFE